MTEAIVPAEELVLVAGATGGVGQLTVARLLEKGFSVRVLTRNANKAQKLKLVWHFTRVSSPPDFHPARSVIWQCMKR